MGLRLASSFARFLRGSAGNVAVSFSLIAPVLLAAAAFGVDEGMLFFQKRQLQSATDISAIVAAGNIAKAEAAARRALIDNGVLTGASGSSGGGIVAGDQTKVHVEVGNYAANLNVPVDKRFTPGGDRNAVRVTVRKPGALFFAAPFSDPPTFSTSAVASFKSEAAFSVGSRLAKLDGGIINGMLNGLTGASLSLSVMDYEALLDVKVSVTGFLDALAKELQVTAGTYDQLLSASASFGQIATALASATGGSGTAGSALRQIALQANYSDMNLPLAKLIDLGPLAGVAIGQGGGAMNITASAMDIIMASATAGGDHQFALDLGAAVPGLASTSLTIAIGERPQNSPWLKVGSTGAVTRTAQTRLRFIAQVAGTGLLAGVTIRLPLYLDVAYAEAELQDISCPAGNAAKAVVTVGAKPGVADLWIADVPNSTMANVTSTAKPAPAVIVSAPLIKVSGAAHANIGNMDAQTLTFSASDIANHVPHSVSTSDFSGALVSSLLGDLKLTVKLSGLSLDLSGVSAAVATQLRGLGAAVDPAVYNVLNLLGVKVGEADVWVNGVRCGRPVLVQ